MKESQARGGGDKVIRPQHRMVLMLLLLLSSLSRDSGCGASHVSDHVLIMPATWGDQHNAHTHTHILLESC